MGAGVRDAFPPPMCVCGGIVYAFRLGGLRVNGYLVCMGLCGKILRSVVGAVPVCPPVSPHKGASIVKCPAHHACFLVWKRRCPPVSPHKGASIVKFPAYNACIFGMETPLRERSGGHVGAAPTVSFGQIARGTVGVVWVDCMWAVLFVGKTVHMNQHHRCCTFVSPGLPTIGGYPG